MRQTSTEKEIERDIEMDRQREKDRQIEREKRRNCVCVRTLESVCVCLCVCVFVRKIEKHTDIHTQMKTTSVRWNGCNTGQSGINSANDGRRDPPPYKSVII